MKLSSLVIMVLALWAYAESGKISKNDRLCASCIKPYSSAWLPVVNELKKGIDEKILHVFQIYSKITAGVKFYVLFRSSNNKVCLGSFVYLGDASTKFNVGCV